MEVLTATKIKQQIRHLLAIKSGIFYITRQTIYKQV